MKLTAKQRARELAAKVCEIVSLRHLASDDALEEAAVHWCERQRFWHGPPHLLAMLEEIARENVGDERDALCLAALYHDVIYDPRAADNEGASANMLLRHAAQAESPIIRRAHELILDSKWERLPSTPLGRRFFDLDTRQLADDCPISERMDYERAIFREYQWAPWKIYAQKRSEFLSGWAKKFPQHARGTAECLEILSGLRPRIAVYPGSFNPFHLGHLSIMRQAEKVFDKVIVALGVNRQKAGAAEALEQRAAELRLQLPFHEIAPFSGLLSAYLDELGFPAAVVRGVRDGTDLEAELRYARFLDELRPGTGVVWISCEPELQHLSSSAIRELAAIEPGKERRYIPEATAIYDLCRDS